MRQNIGLNSRQIAFVAACAAGHGPTAAGRIAGYANGNPCSANMAKLAKKLAAEIEAERIKLGYGSGDEETLASDPGEVAALIADQRRLYAMAIEKGETGTAQKCLRAIERLLKKPGKPGRPSSSTPAAPVPRENMFASMSPEEFTSLVDSILELPEIEG